MVGYHKTGQMLLQLVDAKLGVGPRRLHWSSSGDQSENCMSICECVDQPKVSAESRCMTLSASVAQHDASTRSAVNVQLVMVMRTL